MHLLYFTFNQENELHT